MLSSSTAIVQGPSRETHQKRKVLAFIVRTQKAAVRKNCRTSAVSLAGGLPQMIRAINIHTCMARPRSIDSCVNKSIFCSVAKVLTRYAVFKPQHPFRCKQPGI